MGAIPVSFSLRISSVIVSRVIVSMTEIGPANPDMDDYSLLFPRGEVETFGAVDVVPLTEKHHPGFAVRKFELRTRRYGRRFGTANNSGGGGGRNGSNKPRVVFLVSVVSGGGQQHPRSQLDLLRCVRVAGYLRKSEAFKMLVLPR